MQYYYNKYFIYNQQIKNFYILYFIFYADFLTTFFLTTLRFGGFFTGS